MFRSVFRPYGPVWNFLNNITDALLLSLCWCCCALPLITAGAATTALYDAVVHGMRYREGVVYRRFFRTFRRELKTSLASTLLWGGILLFGVYVLSLLNAAGQENTTAALMAGGYQFLLLLPLAGACWAAVILSRFTHSFASLTGTALRFLLVHPLASLGIALLTRLVIWYITEFPIALAFAPAVTALGWSFLAEPVFAKYGGAIAPETEPQEE